MSCLFDSLPRRLRDMTSQRVAIDYPHHDHNPKQMMKCELWNYAPNDVERNYAGQLPLDIGILTWLEIEIQILEKLRVIMEGDLPKGLLKGRR